MMVWNVYNARWNACNACMILLTDACIACIENRQELRSRLDTQTLLSLSLSSLLIIKQENNEWHIVKD